MRTDFRPFAHATADKAAAYRAVLEVFAAAKASFRVHLRPEDVVEALPQLGEPAALLKQLVDWGNLRADPDTSRVSTVEDFLRARYLYSLTPAGEAAERALQAYDEALGRRGELQAVALSDIRDLLGELAGLDPVDGGRAHRSLTALTERFRGLADNASAFMGSVQRTVDLADGDEEAFIAYKDRLVDYLQRFVRDLIVLSADIAERLAALDPGPLLAAAARHEAADAVPAGRTPQPCCCARPSGPPAGRACGRGSSGTAATRRSRRCCATGRGPRCPRCWPRRPPCTSAGPGAQTARPTSERSPAGSPRPTTTPSAPGSGGPPSG